MRSTTIFSDRYANLVTHEDDRLELPASNDNIAIRKCLNTSDKEVPLTTG